MEDKNSIIDALIQVIKDDIDNLKEVAPKARTLIDGYHKGLQKTRLYNKRKKDLQRLLRDYGYHGKQMESMIHKPKSDVTYFYDNGGTYTPRNCCNYMLYSEDYDLNEELQVSLTLDETPCTILYMATDGPSRGWYGTVGRLSKSDINNMTVSQIIAVAKSFESQVQSKVSTLQYLISSISNYQNNHQNCHDNFENVIKNLSEALENKKK